MERMQPLQDIHKAFITVVRLGIGHESVLDKRFMVQGLPAPDWSAIKALAAEHGLTAIVLDGIDVLRRSYEYPDKRSHGDLNLPAQEMMLEWIGEVLQGYEYRYEQYCKTISDLASFYNTHGFKMMVLKGYACSLDWPKPEHRPCGDIDIWQFGDYKKADELVTKEKGISIEEDQHHHTIFNWGKFMVENHYDFLNVHSHKSSKALEKIFKELGSVGNINLNDNPSNVGKRIRCVEVNGENVYLPSPYLHALFLLRHAASHFAAESITLRNVLDWAFFMDKHSKQVDWDWLMAIVDEYHMRDFFNCINAICVDDLGFGASVFPSVHFLPDLKEKVLNDILCPKFQHEPPKLLFQRLLFKYRRWRANEWKRNLCYDESGLSNFINGLWAHLLKPKTI